MGCFIHLDLFLLFVPHVEPWESRKKSGFSTTHGVSPVSRVLLAAAPVHCQGCQVDFGDNFMSFDELASAQNLSEGVREEICLHLG